LQGVGGWYRWRYCSIRKHWKRKSLSANLSAALAFGDFITNNPDSAVVYKDIAYLLKAFGLIGDEGNGVLEKYYINPGSNGTKHLLHLNRVCSRQT
jgi:hypothetical protein